MSVQMFWRSLHSIAWDWKNCETCIKWHLRSMPGLDPTNPHTCEIHPLVREAGGWYGHISEEVAERAGWTPEIKERMFVNEIQSWDCPDRVFEND